MPDKYSHKQKFLTFCSSILEIDDAQHGISISCKKPNIMVGMHFIWQPFPPSLYNLLEQSLPFYNLLKQHVKQTTTGSLQPNLPISANEKLLIWVGDQVVPRESAKVTFPLIYKIETGQSNIKSIWLLVHIFICSRHMCPHVFACNAVGFSVWLSCARWWWCLGGPSCL